MKTTTTLTALAGTFTLTNAHGYFQSPKGRQPGDVFRSACGEHAYNMMASDINGNIQGLQTLTANQANYNPSTCHLWKCKGLKYDDNLDNIQTYTAGEEVPVYFQVVAPHSGVANISVIDLHTNTVIGSPMQKWEEYAMTSTPMKAEWQNFTITMPTDLGGKCAAKGACAIQMHWDAASVDQTYQSCIDFTMGGSNSSSSKRSHARDFA
ncbi:uncharacterized protein CLAFUR5_10447 [Fulvia fulva]|uniref:Chitin-binding type-4 domain-containing protein n=1 Tax=Passalora fulva TaxID=5499 RepID=A0A9Q8PD55_PASFU|nr:uncharacterized protein CLAFUR5_10447 [Fulvia fulva]KAK4621137.1 hypothetical protein CLAFUR0_11416 [Fulvia fulva]UJO20369.1 hypothetical protein CLAFUR5_10447 [Fulvia fulva]